MVCDWSINAEVKSNCMANRTLLMLLQYPINCFIATKDVNLSTALSVASIPTIIAEGKIISLSHEGQNLPFLGYCLSSYKSFRQLKQCE